MRIDSLESIWNNMGYVIQKHNNYKKTKRNLRNLVYNCAPKHMKDGSIKNTFIEVGYLYLTSAVKDDSQGFVWFDCTDHIGNQGHFVFKKISIRKIKQYFQIICNINV